MFEEGPGIGESGTERGEVGREAWRERSVHTHAHMAGRSDKSEISDVYDFSHAESEAEGMPEGGGGRVRTWCGRLRVRCLSCRGPLRSLSLSLSLSLSHTHTHTHTQTRARSLSPTRTHILALFLSLPPPPLLLPLQTDRQTDRQTDTKRLATARAPCPITATASASQKAAQAPTLKFCSPSQPRNLKPKPQIPNSIPNF